MGIDFQADFSPPYHQVERLTPLVRRVTAENPNPFTFTGTGTYLVGRGAVAVIDPGPELDVHLDAIVDALDEGERITHILVTHTHTDHTAAVPALVDRTGATTVGFGPHGEVPDDDPLDEISFDEHFTDEEMDQITAQWEAIPEELKREGPDERFVPDRPVADGDVVAGPGWTIEVVHTPGHTSNHVCYCLREESTLFTGDHVMGWATSVISPPDGDLFDYMASLDKLVRRDDELYRPTHGPAIENPQDHVQSFIDHRRDREQQIVDALGRGERTIKQIVPTMYADVDKFLWRAAANSVFSHLLALHREGRAVADPGPTLTASWRLI